MKCHQCKGRGEVPKIEDFPTLGTKYPGLEDGISRCDEQVQITYVRCPSCKGKGHTGYYDD